MSGEQVSGSKKQNAAGIRAFIAGVSVIAVIAGAGVLVSHGSSLAGDKAAKEAGQIEPAAGEKADKADRKARKGQKSTEAQEVAIKPGDPIVASVDGQDVKRSDVFEFISGLPEQVRQAPIKDLFPLALEQVVNNRIVSEKSKAASLESDPEVVKLIEQAKGQIVRNVFVDRKVSEQVNKKMLLKSYEELLDKTADIKETRARHILVDSEEKAREIIKKLDGGAKFEDLVKEYTTGSAAENGGDLGYFAKDEMVPEFADTAFALDVGQYTKDPVKTQFGWHVIKIEDRRKRPEPEFEAVKPQLEAQLRQKILTDLLQKWQKESKIKKFDINGEPVRSN